MNAPPNNEEMKENGKTHYSFILFVIENGENSERAKNNLKNLCEKWLPGRYSIDIVDVVDDFHIALDHNILITPSIVIDHPKPKLIIHGDLSNSQKFENILKASEEEMNEG